jgi:hypothetical protein
VDPAWGDALAALDSEPKPASVHSYGYGDVVPPSDGGGPMGTYFQATVAAGHYKGINYGGPHNLKIASSTGTQGNVWSRATATAPPIGDFDYAPVHSVYVPEQKRSYVVGRSNRRGPHWFDHTTKTFQRGTGVPFEDTPDPAPEYPYDSGLVLHIPERKLLVAIFRVARKLRVQWMDISTLNPTLGGTATLSEVIEVPITNTNTPWHHGFYFPDSGKIVLGKTLLRGTTTIDTQAVYELEIPNKLTDNWKATRRPFASGIIDWSITWQGMMYLPALKSALFFPKAEDTAPDTVYVYRPNP